MKKALFSRSLAVAAIGAISLAACSGGSPATVPAPVATPAGSSTNSGSVSIGSLDLMHPASSTPVMVTGSTPQSPTVDVNDTATVQITSQAGLAPITANSQHAFAGSLNLRSGSNARRSRSDVAVNSPYDVSYHGGIVLGSAVSHNVFINYDATQRQAVNFQPGPFLSNLGSDQFITVLYQYLTSPGVLDTAPVSGRYTKGLSGDATGTYASARPGSTNPYFGQLAILLTILNAAPSLGGSGLGHIYHAYLPANVDTCFENPLGTPTSSCYSPDHTSTFAFCAYHGAFTASGQTYLYTVQPYQDVPGCRNTVYNETLPNAVSPTVDPADPGYSTLSHELFETISDPLLNAWWNSGSGDEMADLCEDFDNFVTVNGHQYVLQSEYSDIDHLCVSGILTGSAQTPQTVRRSAR